jgi:hypothetical protein
MPIPEGYLPRKGDVVVLHAVVKYDVNPTEDADSEEGLNVWVTPIEYHSSSRVPLKTIVGVYSRRFDADERVRITQQPELIGVVLSTYEDKVWVKFDNKGFGLRTLDATALEPIPDAAEEPPVDTSDIPETPKSFFENATLVAPAMRFSVGEIVVLARLPDDPERAGSIEPFIGRDVEILEKEGQLYKVRCEGGILELFASDDMLDEKVPF